MANLTAYVLNGPNLNLLGTREPEIYGRDTLADIEKATREKAETLGIAVEFRQTNGEGVLIDWVQEASAKADGLIVNPGAYTHTSIALLDALSAITIPKIELHLSNIHAREEFRRHSVTARAVNGVMMGFGASGYVLALAALSGLMAPPSEN
jgi:3-dehydroquinate dehydratase-2